MTRLLRNVLVLVSLSAATACGGSGPAPVSDGPSCSGTLQGLRFCVDFYEVPSDAAAENACTTQLAGTFAKGACSRTGAVAGCELSQNGVDEVTWVYSDSGATQDQVSQACAQNNQDFVLP
jgi:hypothetical protein